MTLFGSVATMKPKPGKEEAVSAMIDEWWRLRSPGAVPGAVAVHLFRAVEEPGTFMFSVVFDSREEYEANANDPAQSMWHRKLASMLIEEPVWTDGDILSSHTRGAADSDPR